MKRILDDILAQPGFSWAQLLTGVVMYAAWVAAYVRIFIRCQREKTYGVPLLGICLNILWEFAFSFELFDSRLNGFFHWGNRAWFVFDIFIVYQVLRYGRDAQVYPVLKRHFGVALLITFVAAGLWLWTFTRYFNDVKGVASSMSINLLFSVLYIFMLFNRPDLRGLDYPAAWLKMIGTLAGSIFLYHWWPAQFTNGHLTTHPEIREPTTYCYMIFLYAGILFFDCLYIWLLGQRRRELVTAALARQKN